MPDFEVDIEKCLEVLHSGGLILYPTDTVWGIGCDATDDAAVQGVFALKARESIKSLIILLGSGDDLDRYLSAAHQPALDYLQMEETPVTVIYPGARNLAASLIGPDGSIGIRIVADPFCKALISRFGKPLVSTSANRSGDPAPGNFKQIPSAILEGVDYVVRYRRDDPGEAKPSKIVKFGPKGEIILIRQ